MVLNMANNNHCDKYGWKRSWCQNWLVIIMVANMANNNNRDKYGRYRKDLGYGFFSWLISFWLAWLGLSCMAHYILVISYKRWSEIFSAVRMLQHQFVFIQKTMSQINKLTNLINWNWELVNSINTCAQATSCCRTDWDWFATIESFFRYFLAWQWPTLAWSSTEVTSVIGNLKKTLIGPLAGMDWN